MKELVLLLVMCSLVNSQSESLCAFDLNDIELRINESMNGAVTDFVLNCLAHDGSFAESISLSVFTSAIGGMRYDFQCYEGSTLIPTVSARVSNASNHACSSCNFSLLDPCLGECADRCGSCPSDDLAMCTSCQYLASHNDHSDCRENTSCAMLGFVLGEAGCECPEGHFLMPTEEEPQYLLPNEEVVYHCVDECTGSFFRAVTENEGDFCFDCGIPKCMECMKRGGSPQCEKCIEGYHPYPDEFDNDCITEEDFEEKEIEEQTHDLEHEQEIEDEEQEENNLLLKILLPIFCILTVVVFVSISVFAHNYYPYLDHKGDYRSKTKPAFVRESTVWRPRPTIRFR